MDDYVVIENVSEEFDEIDGTILKNVQSEYFANNEKVEKNTYHVLETPKENHIQYVMFNNENEISNGLNGKSNTDNCSEWSSNTSSSESINFRRIVLTPIQENEVKLSNGCDIISIKLSSKYNYISIFYNTISFQNEAN